MTNRAPIIAIKQGLTAAVSTGHLELFICGIDDDDRPVNISLDGSEAEDEIRALRDACDLALGENQ